MQNEIKPHKITKPIQLLSAWLFGLLLLNSTFLATALTIKNEGLVYVLVWAAIINVPIFLAAIFLLQTKFRPEMQEDSFYAKYLDSKTGTYKEISIPDVIDKKFRDFEAVYLSKKETSFTQSSNLLEFKSIKIMVNDHLPKLTEIREFLYTNGYSIQDYFGKCKGTQDIPDKAIISFDENIDIELVKPILKEALRLGINYFEVGDSSLFFADADIYIGSYGNISGEITVDFLSQLDILKQVDLILYKVKK